MEEYVVLTDTDGRDLGIEEKIAAHQKGVLHKAFSIFVFNLKGEMLLQQRAFDKYHFGGLWSNTCCSHPRLGETEEEAAHRRLQEELGFDTPLTHLFTFVYRAEDETSGLIEHERDVVFIGFYDAAIQFNPAEIHAIKWLSIKDLEADLHANAASYTYWFKFALHKMQNEGILDIETLKTMANA